MEFHPNLDPATNMNMAMSEINGGVFLKDLQPGTTVRVQTEHVVYDLANHGDRWVGQGGPFLQQREIEINGSTFGGSMLKTEFIGIGMCLELTLPVPGGFKSFDERMEHTLTSTPIESISVRFPESESVYANLAGIMFGHPSGGMNAKDAKRFVFAQAYGSSKENLVEQSGLGEKRVSEIVDLLKFLALPCARCLTYLNRPGSPFCNEACEVEAAETMREAIFADRRDASMSAESHSADCPDPEACIVSNCGGGD